MSSKMYGKGILAESHFLKHKERGFSQSSLFSRITRFGESLTLSLLFLMFSWISPHDESDTEREEGQ